MAPLPCTLDGSAPTAATPERDLSLPIVPAAFAEGGISVLFTRAGPRSCAASAPPGGIEPGLAKRPSDARDIGRRVAILGFDL